MSLLLLLQEVMKRSFTIAKMDYASEKSNYDIIFFSLWRRWSLKDMESISFGSPDDLADREVETQFHTWAWQHSFENVAGNLNKP